MVSMKKTILFLMIIFINFSSGNVYAKEMQTSEIDGAAYIIGTHLFTRNKNENYNGVLTTQFIMLASKTIKTNNLNDMVIYYRNPKGVWRNAITNTIIENPPTTFDIDYIDTIMVDNKNINDAEISLQESSFIYDGNPKMPKVVVTYGEVTLVENVDYTLSYENNVEIGVGKVNVNGTGEYTGTKSINFEISPKVEHLPTSEYDYSFNFNNSQVNGTILTRFNDGVVGGKTNGNFDFQNNELVISLVNNYADSYDIYSGANMLNANYTDIKYIGVEVENRSSNTVLFSIQGKTKSGAYIFVSSSGSDIFLVDKSGTISIANGKSEVFRRFCIYLPENFKGKVLIPVDRIIDNNVEANANPYTREPIKEIGFFFTDEVYNNSSVMAVQKLFITSLDLSKMVDVRYSFDSYIKPFWKSNVMYDETITLHQDEAGTIKGTLLFKPSKIISIKDYSLKTTYVEGKDYIWDRTSNIIYYGTNSSLPYFKQGELAGVINGVQVPSFPTWENNMTRFGDCLYTVGEFLYGKQLVVTYEYDMSQVASKNIVYTNNQSNKLQTVINKMNSGQDVNILFYGDSIFAGYDASSLHGREPYLPKSSDYVGMKLNQYSKGTVIVDNKSVGGWTAEDGYNALYEDINKTDYSKYDLAIISFGMNNPNTDINVYKQKIEDIISLLKQKNPSIEIILVSCMNPNPRLRWNESLNYTLPSQRVVLKQISDDAKYGSTIAFVDMYSVHNKILEYKAFASTTGNNVNHPNDWLIRVYAQNILSAIINY